MGGMEAREDPPLRQPPVPWAEVNFASLVLPPPPALSTFQSIVPTQASPATAESLAAVERGWTTVTRSKKRLPTTPPNTAPPPEARRRRLNNPDKKNASVGTDDLPRLGGKRLPGNGRQPPRTPAPTYEVLLSPTPLPRYAERNPAGGIGPLRPAMDGSRAIFLEEGNPRAAQPRSPQEHSSGSAAMDIDPAPDHADSPTLDVPLALGAHRSPLAYQYALATPALRAGVEVSSPEGCNPTTTLQIIETHQAQEHNRPYPPQDRRGNSAETGPLSLNDPFAHAGPSRVSQRHDYPSLLDGEHGLAAPSSAQSTFEPLAHSTPRVNPLTGKPTLINNPTTTSTFSYPARPVDRHPLQHPLFPSMPTPLGGLPDIRFSDPDGVVAGTDSAFLRTMREDSTDNARPFRVPMVEGLPPEPVVRDIQSRAYQTIREATGESEFWIIPPRPAGTPGEGHPSSWFVRGLSRHGARLLETRRVISNPAITIFIYPLTLSADHVATLGGFISDVGGQIENMIRGTFGDLEVRTILAQHVASNPIFDNIPTDLGVEFVLETLEVATMVLESGAIIANVYLQSPAVGTDGWRYLRHAISLVPFVDGYNAPAVVRTYRCAICAGGDHPSHACQYPSLPGWRGPTPPPENPTPLPPPPGNALVYRPRPQNEARPRLPKGKGRGHPGPPPWNPPGQNSHGGHGGPAGGATGIGSRPY